MLKNNTPKNMDEYIGRYPKDVQEILKKIRVTIRKAAPAAIEAISYQIPTFKLGGNLVHFAAFADHITTRSMKQVDFIHFNRYIYA